MCRRWLVAPFRSATCTTSLPSKDPRAPTPTAGKFSSSLASDLPYSMAAPEGVPHDSAVRTIRPPTGREPQTLPPRHRKFPFETRAADQLGGAAVAAERLLNLNDESYEPEQQARGFGSPGTRGWADGVGRVGLGMEFPPTTPVESERRALRAGTGWVALSLVPPPAWEPPQPSTG